MSMKQFVSPEDMKDLRIFMGRALSMLGDLTIQLGHLTDFLEYTFRSEASQYADDLPKKVQYGNRRDESDDEDYGDGSDEE